MGTKQPRHRAEQRGRTFHYGDSGDGITSLQSMIKSVVVKRKGPTAAGKRFTKILIKILSDIRRSKTCASCAHGHCQNCYNKLCTCESPNHRTGLGK